MNFQCDLHFDSKLYLCNMSFFLPFLFLWFSLISSRIKGFRWVSLISFSSSKHCLPPRTTAAQVLHLCQNCREGWISYSRTNLTSKRGRSTEGADKRLGPFWPTIYCMCVSTVHTVQKPAAWSIVPWQYRIGLYRVKYLFTYSRFICILLGWVLNTP